MKKSARFLLFLCLVLFSIKKIVEKTPDVNDGGTRCCPGNGCKADSNAKEKMKHIQTEP